MRDAGGSMRIHQMTRDSFTSTTAAAAPKTRYRTSKEQLAALEDSFAAQSRPEREERERLSRDLGMSYKQVVVWFQNRRAKERNVARKVIDSSGGVDDMRGSVPLESQVFEWSATAAPPDVLAARSLSPPSSVQMISPRRRPELPTGCTLPISKNASKTGTATVTNLRMKGRNSIQAPFGEWNHSSRIEISPRRAGSLPTISGVRQTNGLPPNYGFGSVKTIPQYTQQDPCIPQTYQFAPQAPSLIPLPLLPQLRAVTEELDNLPMPSAIPESFSDLRRYSLNDKQFQSMVPAGIPPATAVPYHVTAGTSTIPSRY